MMQYITITIPSYGLMAVIGAISAVLLLYYKGMVCETDFNFKMSDFGLLCLSASAGCLIGSKIIFGVTQLPDVFENFSFGKLAGAFLMGGFVFYGGLFGAYAGSAVFAKLKKYNVTALLDLITPSFILFHIFGRIGCLFAGCCYGLKLENELVIGNIHFNYFPLQAVEAVFEAVLFILVEKTPLKKHRFKSYISCYAVYRFIAEFFRGDEIRGIWAGLSTSQWISLIVVLSVISFSAMKKINIKRNYDIG